MAITPDPYRNILEDSTCSLCLEPLSNPVRLSCGHIFDFNCINDWFQKSPTCPLDRTVVDMKNVEYCDGLLEKMKEVTFNFNFLTGLKIEPVAISVEETVLKLKSVVCKILNQKGDGVQPRNILFIFSNKRLYSDTKLSKYDIAPGKTHQIYVRYKLAEYGRPCDYCFGESEKEKKCKHQD